MRLDVVLAQRIPELSRRRARSLCVEGLVTVNGKKARAGTILSAGDVVETAAVLSEPQARPELAEQSGGPSRFITVLYEDEQLLVVSKPGAMSSVTLRHNDNLTLADCVASYCAQCLDASPDRRESGLVQRLDFYTTGAVLAAKTPAAWRSLHQQLLSGEMRKKYFALVEGKLDSRSIKIDFPLQQVTGGKEMKAVKDQPGQTGKGAVFSAETTVLVHGGYDCGFSACFVSLVELQCRRVRRHQIRVHLSAINHPLVGDEKYGSRFASCGLSEARSGFFLHAAEIEFRHPQSNRILVVNALSAELDEIKRQALLASKPVS